MKFIKRLNWSSFAFMLVVTAMGAVSRKQDPSLMHSFKIWLIVGLPIAAIFLFVGMKPKK